VLALPVLPLVDLLILLGTVSLAIGFVLKAIVVTTVYYPTVMGFASSDFVLITGVCFGFAMVLIARTWLKLNEPGLLTLQSRLRAERAVRRAEEIERDHAAQRERSVSGSTEVG
jgi:hypothetical protein